MNQSEQIQHPFTRRPEKDKTWQFVPELMTEEELIHFLRIPEISEAVDYHNVIEHLKRMRNLPRLQLCKKVLYPTHAILQWIQKETKNGE